MAKSIRDYRIRHRNTLELLHDDDCDDDGGQIRRQHAYFSDDYDDGLFQHYDDHQKLAHASINDGDFHYALVDLHDGLLLQVNFAFVANLAQFPVVVPT